MGGFNWNCELTQYLSNTCQITLQTCCVKIYAILGCKCSPKKYRIHWGMDGRSYFHEIKKHYTPKKLFPAFNLQGKIFFRNNYFGSHPFLTSSYFTKICTSAVVCYFSVFKLIGRGPTNIYLFKVNNRTTRKRYEICLKYTINTI